MLAGRALRRDSPHRRLDRATQNMGLAISAALSTGYVQIGESPDRGPSPLYHKGASVSRTRCMACYDWSDALNENAAKAYSDRRADLDLEI